MLQWFRCVAIGSSLRPAVPADIPTLELIRREPSVERWWGLLAEGELATDIEEGDGRILAIELRGAVIGAVQWYQEKEPAFRHAGMDIYLTSEAQGLGLGTEVVRLLATWLIRDQDFHRLVIDPAAANERAIARLRQGRLQAGRPAAPLVARAGRHVGGSAADGPAGGRAHVSTSSRFAIRPSRIVNALRSGGSLASDTIR